MHYGVDVSSNNAHPINYPAVVNYLKQLGGGAQPFAVVKITQGSGYINPDDNADISGFRGAGAAVAGYLMDQGNVDPAAEEAVYRRVAASLPQTDDVELPEGLAVSAYIAHTRSLVAQDGAALVYLNQSEVAEGFPTGAGLWLAQYNGVPGYTSYPCLVHQYSSSASIPGAGGTYDMNAWVGSDQSFQYFFTGDPMPPSSGSCIGMARTASGHGYWQVNAVGKVTAHGDAISHGSITVALAKPVVGMAATPSGHGYWLVAADGGVFCFGDAHFHGSTGGVKLAQPVIGIQPTPTGNGYWLYASDGGVFSFGDAPFEGSGV